MNAYVIGVLADHVRPLERGDLGAHLPAQPVPIHPAGRGNGGAGLDAVGGDHPVDHPAQADGAELIDGIDDDVIRGDPLGLPAKGIVADLRDKIPWSVPDYS